MKTDGLQRRDKLKLKRKINRKGELQRQERTTEWQKWVRMGGTYGQRFEKDKEFFKGRKWNSMGNSNTLFSESSFINRATCLKVIEKAQSQLESSRAHWHMSKLSTTQLTEVTPLFSWAIHLCSWPVLQGPAEDATSLQPLGTALSCLPCLSVSCVHPQGSPLLFLPQAGLGQFQTLLSMHLPFSIHLPLSHFPIICCLVW